MAAGPLASWGNDLYTGKKSYNIVGTSRRWFIVAGLVLAFTLAMLLGRGLNLGIEFRGGSEFNITGVSDVSQQIAVDTVLQITGEEEARVSQIGANALRVQTAELSDAQTTELARALAEAYDVPVTEVSSAFVGPSWGQDVTSKALRGLVIFLALVAVVMTVYFRDWRMALAGILALLHDLVITVGLYAAIGWEVTPATVIGFLTILGYSLYDTVVVFDKIRENTERFTEQSRYTHGELSNLAVNQTLIRSINTGVVAVLPVGSILVIGALALGAGTLRDIALALFIGILVGTYSSVFLATPLLVWMRNREAPIAAHTEKVLARRAEARTPVDAEESVRVSVGALVPGAHLGHAAQPHRRKGPARKGGTS